MPRGGNTPRPTVGNGMKGGGGKSIGKLIIKIKTK